MYYLEIQGPPLEKCICFPTHNSHMQIKFQSTYCKLVTPLIVTSIWVECEEESIASFEIHSL